MRAVEVAGGFATVLQKGEKDAGIILLLTISRGQPATLWERMPQVDGSRPFRKARVEDPENRDDFVNYCERRRNQDPDCWMIELDVPNSDRFVPGDKA